MIASTTGTPGRIWTAAIFRRYPPSRGGDVIALFPDLPHDAAGRYCVSYQHLGQHGAADYSGVIAATRPADAEEYAPLLAELQRIGYRVRVRARRGRR